MALSLGVGLYELARSSLFIYSFRFEPSHLLELCLYPIVFALLPALFRGREESVEPGRRVERLIGLSLTLIVALASLPFVYERLLIVEPVMRLGLSLLAVMGLAALLSHLRRGVLSPARFELLCAGLYCVVIDSGLELSKALLGAFSGRGGSLKVVAAWLMLYIGLGAWLALHQYWSAQPKRLSAVIGLCAGIYYGLCVHQPEAPAEALDRQSLELSLRGGERPENRPDIFLLIFDAMRGDARRLARELGGPSSRLEQLEALAERSLDFREAHSGSLATYESIPRLLELKGYQTFLRLGPLKRHARWERSLPGRLSRAGYETHLLTDYPNAVLKGFDALDWGSVSSLRSRHLRLRSLLGDAWAALSGQRALLKARRGATRASATELSLIEQLSALMSAPRLKPRLVVLHFATPHQPYAAPPYQGPKLPADFDHELANEDFLARFSDATAAEIERFKRHYLHALQGSDQALRRVLELLRFWGEPERDLLVVTSDHGELFGDHGVTRLAHGGHLYQASHHVPLLISGMGLEPAQIDEPVSQMRLAATLYELLGAEGFEEESLSHRRAPEEAGFELRYAQRGGLAQLGGWRLIWSRPKWLGRADWAHKQTVELYHVAEDPEERHELSAEHPERVELLADHFKIRLAPVVP